MVPILIKASNPEEIDEKFFDEIFKPLEKTSETFSNIEEYEESLAKEEKEKAENKKAAEAAKKAKEKDSKNKTSTDNDEDDEDCSNENCEVEKPKKQSVEKPKKDSPFKKYEDPVIDYVSAEDFQITTENYSELKDLVDKLLIMNKTNELGLDWEQKLKDFKKSTKEKESSEEIKIEEKPVEILEEETKDEPIEMSLQVKEVEEDIDLFDFESLMND